MVKVAFIQDTLYEYFGPMYLSSALKKNGHMTKMFILSEDKNIINSLKKFKPDLIAFSVVSGLHKWNIEFAKKVKMNIDALVIFGGPHPTFFSEVINEKAVDIICLGEGEFSFVELADSLDKGKINYNIEGLWFKKDGKIIKNPLRNLVEDLDSIPFPDRELYYSKSHFLRNFPTKRFATSRGCPYNCSFCYNPARRKMNQGKGKYIRRRSPQNVIEEIKQMSEKYPLKTVRFVDDNFTLNHEWLKELLPLYKKEINLPFTFLGRADELNEEITRLLKKSGCDSVIFGIETADEEMRNKVLKKSLKNKSIINSARLLKKYKIKIGTYNMIGLPGETIDDAINTLKFNVKIKADYVLSSIFQPYPKTELGEYCVENGYVDKDFNVNDISSVFESSTLKSEYTDQFTNLQKFFNIGVKFPITIPFIRRLIKLKPNKAFSAIGTVSYGIRSLISFRIGFINGLKMGVKMLNNMKKG